MSPLEDDFLDLGALPPGVRQLLQEGVALRFAQPSAAEAKFRAAIALVPEALPAYRCLVKLHHGRQQFGAAYATTLEWLSAAAHQANLPTDWRQWHFVAGHPANHPGLPAALAALAAYAFIQLQRGNAAEASEALDHLQRMDPNAVSASPVAAFQPQTEPV
jgi:hypothetical protein